MPLVRASLAVATVAVLVRAASAQPGGPPLDTLLERMGAYLRAYEPDLSALIADETFEQRTTSASAPSGVALPQSYKRRLQSTVSFLRLPGGEAWLGLREVRSVDGKAVPHANALQALLTAPTADARAQAVNLAVASSQHNLGHPRTINMPALPLDILHPENRDRLTFRINGHETIRGVRTTRLDFDETTPPSLIHGNDGRPVIVRGRAWVEHDTGAVWRAHIFYRDFFPAVRVRSAAEAEVRVEFARDAALALLVPIEMKEVFAVRLGHGEGHARYSNFRRFSTSARIVPQ